MKTNLIYFLLLIIVSLATSCTKKEENKADGTIDIIFDHIVGNEDLAIKVPGDKNYDFKDINGQEFNISKFRYFISEIKFSSPEGTSFGDPNKITTDASKVTGFYHIIESNTASQKISINNVTARTYDKIQFTVGVKFYTFIPGPAGGILDPANGAPFLNMQAGYINMSIEGNALNSGQVYVDNGNEPDILEGTFNFELSGWRNISPESGQDTVFVDNTRIIELDFDKLIKVEEGLNPEVHLKIDLSEILEGNDFSETYSVKGPIESRAFSKKFKDAFILDFVKQ